MYDHKSYKALSQFPAVTFHRQIKTKRPSRWRLGRSLPFAWLFSRVRQVLAQLLTVFAQGSRIRGVFRAAAVEIGNHALGRLRHFYFITKDDVVSVDAFAIDALVGVVIRSHAGSCQRNSRKKSTRT